MNALAPLPSYGPRYRIATDAPLALAPPGDLRREYFGGHIPTQEQYRPHFGSGLDMDRIESAIIAANFGRMHYLCDLARETIFLDGHVNALLQKRLNRLGALDWQLTPATGPGIDEGRAKERCEEVRENLAMMPNFRERLIDLAWGNFDGRAASEIEWYRWGRAWRARDLHWIHPRRLCFGPDRDVRVQDPMRQTGNFQDVGVAIETIPFKFLVFKPRMFGDYQEREGLAPRTLYWSFFARVGRRAQLALMEIFGSPWRIMVPKQGMPNEIPGANNVDLYKAGFEALINLGYQNTARMPPGVEVQIVQPEQGAGQVHNDVITDCRQVLTKMYLGGVATTEAISTGLGSSIGNVHLSEEDLIIASDARRISECVEDQLTDAIVVVNYGPAEAAYAPKFAIRTDPPIDRGEEGKRVAQALDIGLRIAEEEARERTGFRAVREDEPYLVKFQRTAESGQVAPPPAAETVWPLGEAPVTGEVPAAPDVAVNLPDGPSDSPPPGSGGGLPAPPGEGPPALPGAPAVPALPPPKAPGELPGGGGAPGAPGDPGHKLPPGGNGSDDGQALSAGDDTPDEDIARLAARMTELGIERCAHDKVNRCRICGIERVRDVSKAEDGTPVWHVAWKPIGAVSTRALPPEPAAAVTAPAAAPPAAAPPTEPGTLEEPAPELAAPGDELSALEAELEQEEPDEDEMRTARDLGIYVQRRYELQCLNGEGADYLLAENRQLARKQPPTAFGSPDDIVTRGTAAFAAEAQKFGDAIAKRVDGLSTGKAIDAAIKRAAKAWKPARFVKALAPELEHAQWLGALDADYEAKSGRAVKVETFTELWADLVLMKTGAAANDAGADPDPAFAKRPQIDAGESFIEREVVTRDVFDDMAIAAQRRAFTVANAATKEMARAVKRELVRQVALGADLADFKTHALKRLESAGWTPLNPSHAETVLRTNVMGAYNSGRYRQMAQPKVVALRPYWQILGVGDDRQRKSHHDIQNKVFRADDPIFKTAYPPFGYNCFLPGTQVQGIIRGASRARYSGKAFELTTAKGRRLSVTANHPVLAAQGFTAANALRVGMHLVCYADEAGVGSLRSGAETEHHDAPASCEQVFGALAQLSGSDQTRAARVDFHGEAASFDGQIEVVGSYRQLLLATEAAEREQTLQSTLQSADLSLAQVAGLSSSDAAVERIDGAAPSTPGLAQLPPDGGATALLDLRPFDGLGFGAAAHHDALQAQSAPDGVTGTAAFVSQLFERGAGSVQLDELVEIREFEWEGHVYDFEAKTGWIIAGGIIASNCRCRARSLSKAQGEQIGISSGSSYDDELPDKGFASGISNLLDVPKVPNLDEAANDVEAEAANDTGADE